jgi:hypothetical protein
MPRGKIFLLLPALLVLLLAVTLPAAADRGGWNEPSRAPGYDQNGLLRINTDFFNMAAATGGDFYFWAPGEFAAKAGLLNLPLASEPITLAYGSAKGNFAQRAEVPVDVTISRLSLFTGAQRLDKVRLLRPDGRSIKANPSGVSVQDFKHMRIVTVDDPEPGVWRVEMRGAGRYVLSARYQTDRARLKEQDLNPIDLIDFAFVEERGRPGHRGLFPLKQPVRSGELHHCRVTVSGIIKHPSIELVSAKGEVLAKIPPDASVAESGDEFTGACEVPDQPFRVRVRGRDMEGHLFQRLTAGLTTPASLQ